MSKELKAPDKVTQKMTRDGAIAENLLISYKPERIFCTMPLTGRERR